MDEELLLRWAGSTRVSEDRDTKCHRVPQGLEARVAGMVGNHPSPVAWGLGDPKVWPASAKKIQPPTLWTQNAIVTRLVSKTAEHCANAQREIGNLKNELGRLWNSVKQRGGEGINNDVFAQGTEAWLASPPA